MDQRSLTLLAVLFWVVLALSLVCILWMFFSLARQGDERRKAILTRACCHTFYTVVVLLVLGVAESLFRSLTGADYPSVEFNALILLALVAVLYTVNLFWCKRKMGG